MADHPLRPATRLSLGEPLPHQLADRARTPLEVIACKSRSHLLPRRANSSWSYLVLARLSTGYPGLQGRLSTCYSPVRRFTRRVAPTFSHDLHVSGTPPAFVLSQDQTLHKRLIILFGHVRLTDVHRKTDRYSNKTIGQACRLLESRRPIKGMHYYSVFKDPSLLEAKGKTIAR